MMYAILSPLFLLASHGILLDARPESVVAQEVESSPWYAGISKDIRIGEYSFQSVPGELKVFSAPNRARLPQPNLA